LEDVDFQLAVFKEKNANGTPKANARKWTALKASAGLARLEGLESIIQVEGNDLMVAINVASVDKKTIDFLATKTQLNETIGSEDTMILDMGPSSDTAIYASGHVKLSAFDFLYAEATLVFERSQQTVTLTKDGDDADTEIDTVTVDVLTMGAVDINAFVGANGGSSNQVGFEIRNVDFALMTMTEHLSDARIAEGATARKWTAMKASAESVGFVGIDGVTMTGSAMIAVNFEADWDGSLVDFQATPITIKPKGATDGMVFDIKRQPPTTSS
jgi:hypothetical protein